MAGGNSCSNFFHSQRGSKIHYTSTGNATGPLLIALHGLGGSTETFIPLIPYLPLHKYNIICVDFEGFGKSVWTNSDVSVSRYVSDVDELISHLQGPTLHADEWGPWQQPVIIIGHSLGSIVALHYAAKKPNNVARLALLGVGRSAAHIEAARQRMLGMAAKVRAEGIGAAAEMAMITNFPKDTPEETKIAVRDAVAASNPEAYARTCEAMVSPDHDDPDYSKIACPTVFITGDQDMISPPERAREVSGLVRGPTAVSIVKGGHQPILSDVQGVSRALIELFSMT